MSGLISYLGGAIFSIFKGIATTTLSTAQNTVKWGVTSSVTGIVRAIPSQAYNVAKNSVKGTAGKVSAVETQALKVAGVTGGFVSGAANLVIYAVGFLIGLFVVLCLYGVIGKGGRSVSRIITDFGESSIRDFRARVPTPLYFLGVVVSSLIYNTGRVLGVVFRLLPFLIPLFVVLALWLFVFELNKESVVLGIDTTVRGSVMLYNVALSAFDLTIQGSNLMLPLINSEIHGNFKTGLAFYDAVSKSQEFSVDVSDVQKDVQLFTVQGRRLAEKKGRIPQFITPRKIAKAIKSKILFDQSNVKLTILVVTLLYSTGIGAILFTSYVVFQAVIVKSMCIIADFNCAISEFGEFIVNGIIYIVNLIITPAFPAFPYVTTIACGEGNFLATTPRECAGGVTTVLTPGLFRGLLDKRRLGSVHDMLHCEFYDGRYTEYYATTALHTTSNYSLSCPTTYKALAGALQSLVVMEKLDVTSECLEMCNLGTWISSCPEQESMQILGSCDQPTRRRLIPNRLSKLGRVNFTAPPAHSSGGSRFQLLHDLKRLIPAEFTVSGVDCNLKIQNPLDIYEIFVNLYCMVSYITSKPQIKDSLFPKSSHSVSHRHLEAIRDYVNPHQVRQMWFLRDKNIDPFVYFLEGTVEPLSESPSESTPVSEPRQRRRTQNKISKWMMPCASDENPSLILCVSDMKTCVTDWEQCPEINPLDSPSQFQVLYYQYTQIMNVFKQFDPQEYISRMVKCLRELRPENDPISSQNIDKSVEERENLEYCNLMLAPSKWEPEYATVSATGVIDSWLCSSTTLFNGCYCPGFYDSSVLREFYESSPFSPTVLYVINNGILDLWYVFSWATPLSIVIIPFLPLSTQTHWELINSDLTDGEKALCFVAHLGSLGMVLYLALVATLVALWVVWNIETIQSYLTDKEDSYSDINTETDDHMIIVKLHERLNALEKLLHKKE